MNSRATGWPSRALGAVAVLSLLLAGCSSTPEPGPTPSSSPTIAPEPVDLSVGVFGAPGEVAALSDGADDFSDPGLDVSVTVRTFGSRDQAVQAYRGGDLPDVFMLSQRDLAWFTERDLTHPVDELLDERGVSFGDDYARDSLAAFSKDNSLACMPYSISPMVIYLNTDLVDFDKMARRGLDVPEPNETSGKREDWTFDQFAAAAQFATKPGRNIRGVYIEPTLLGLAPFIYSGGGKVFDDILHPSSLAFSDGSTRAALATTLTLLRNAQVTPTPEQLDKRDGLELFERGRLGMIAGYRNLVPELRQVPGLRFDVMPMPKISRSATVGDVTGLCISNTTTHLDAAADLLVHLLSADAVSKVAEQGYLVPANVSVASSDAFLQPGLEPANAVIFNQSVRDIQVPPLLSSWARLEASVAPLLDELVTGQFLDDTLDEITSEIDIVSQPILAPPSETPSPSGSASASP
ncbi:MAG: extracellular solute-binding protein [Nocardioidaceae bacterium]|nr:extracellular solute-binding protein [Nocardioidaceae bacterium]